MPCFGRLELSMALALCSLALPPVALASPVASAGARELDACPPAARANRAGGKDFLGGFRSPGGIMLWSPGRAATGTIYETLFDAADRSGEPMWPCCGQKEGFKGAEKSKSKQYCDLTEENVLRCHSEARQSIFFTHIKPMWLDKKHAQIVNATHLMQLAKAGGFKLVVVSGRRNLLARDISSWIQTGHSPIGNDPKPFRIDRNEWQLHERILEEGKEAARALGLRIVEANFEEIITDACSVIHDLICGADAEGLPLPLPQTCSTVSSHTVMQRHGSRLDQDVGKKAAYIVRKQLKGTPDEWMLDVNALHP